MSLVGGDEVRKRPSHQYQSVLTPLAKTWYDTVKPNNDVVAHCSLSLQQDAVQERTTKQADGFCCTSIGHVRRQVVYNRVRRMVCSSTTPDFSYPETPS
jgi:hypothetical protein